MYVAAVAFGGDENEATDELIDNRVALWGVGLLGVYALGFLRGGNEEEHIAWRLGDRDHCGS